MNAINSTTGVLDNLRIDTKTETAPKSNNLGRNEFLQLLMVKMQNQDPLSPQDDTQFIAELAQFSQLEETEKLNKSFTDLSASMLSNQALQASALVGRSVSVPAKSSSLRENDVISGSVTVPASTSDLKINIYSEAGALVESVPVGPQSAGESVFRWDGFYMEMNGKLLDWKTTHADGVAPGTYRFEVTASIDGEPTQLETALSANVNSVTIGAGGKMMLNLAGIGPVAMSSVKQFN